MDYDIIHVGGKPHVLVPIHDYTALKNGNSKSEIPDEIREKLAVANDSPIKIIRKFREMTQKDLAENAGLSRPYLTEIETGRKEGSVRALKSIASALDVSLENVVGD